MVPIKNQEREINLVNSNDMSFSSGGTLYGLFSNKPIPGITPRIEMLGTINPLTGSASVLLPEGGVVPPPMEQGGAIAFSEDDVLYRAGESLSILNVGTGEATLVKQLSFLNLPGGSGTPRINAMEMDPETGVMFAAVNTGNAGGGPNYLATLETETGEVTLIDRLHMSEADPVTGDTFVNGLAALAFVPEIAEAGSVMPSGLQQYSCNVVARGRYKESSDRYKIRVKKLTESFGPPSLARERRGK